MKVVVTGGSGFIGSHLIREILREWGDDNPEDANNQVYNIDKLTYAGNKFNNQDYENDSRYYFIQGDIADLEVWDELPRGIDIIYNLAAETHVDNSIKSADEFVKTNMLGTLVGLEYAKKYGCKFIQIGSDEEYGEAIEEFGSKETDMCAPKSPYAASKLAASQLALSYHHTHNVPVIVTRGCNTYGPNQYPEKLIPFFVKCIVQDKPCTIYGTGENKREWIHVEDHVKGILFAANTPLSGEIYNIGSNIEYSVEEMFNKIREIIPQAQQIGIADRPGHIVRHKVNWDKMERKGWKPTKDFDEEFKKTVEWFKNNKKFLGLH